MKFINHYHIEDFEFNNINKKRGSYKLKLSLISSLEDYESNIKHAQTYEEILDMVDYDADDITYDIKNNKKFKNMINSGSTD